MPVANGPSVEPPHRPPGRNPQIHRNPHFYWGLVALRRPILTAARSALPRALRAIGVYNYVWHQANEIGLLQAVMVLYESVGPLWPETGALRTVWVRSSGWQTRFLARRIHLCLDGIFDFSMDLGSPCCYNLMVEDHGL